jgi:hypothetical protein
LAESLFNSNRDIALFAIPLIFMLVFSVFRVDRIIAAPKVPLSRRRPRCGIDETGQPIIRDPDGRLSASRRQKRF